MYRRNADSRIDMDFQKRQVQLPATMFNRSPHRDNENRMNVGNTPGRRQTQYKPTNTDSCKRISVSPLRHTRQPSQHNSKIEGTNSTSKLQQQQQQQYTVQPHLSINRQMLMEQGNHSNMSPNMSCGQSFQLACKNHQDKMARFTILIDNEEIMYCEKCAILLASQGFKVQRMQEEQPVQQSIEPKPFDNQRQREIDVFLKDLEQILNLLAGKKKNIESELDKNHKVYTSQLQNLHNLFGKIVEFVESQRQQIEKMIKDEKIRAEKDTQHSMNLISQAMEDSLSMKEDILTSLDLIREADQKSFRPVMESYKENARKFKQTTQKITIPQILMRKIELPELQSVKRLLLSVLQAEFPTGQKKSAPTVSGNLSPTQHSEMSKIDQAASLSSANFSFEAQIAAELNRDFSSGVYRHEDVHGSPNSPQVVDSNKWMMKSSMKNSKAVGLIADFNE